MKRAYIVALGLALVACAPLSAASAEDEAIPIASHPTAHDPGPAPALVLGGGVARQPSGGGASPLGAGLLLVAVAVDAGPRTPTQEARSAAIFAAGAADSPAEVGGWPS